MSSPGHEVQPPGLRAVAVGVGALLAIVLVFAAIRVVTDWPHILAGTQTDNEFAVRYVENPWTAYLHIGLGVVYLLGAPLQLSRRFRTRHYTLHRRLGRVLVACGVASGVFAVVFGLLHPWGGGLEAAAALIFGTWFVVCLLLALRAIRAGRVAQHRRWMIRAFAVGVGIGTIRIWVGLFIGLRVATGGGTDDMAPGHTGFGLAFWLALTMHVVLGEWWLRRTPDLDG